MNMPDDIEPARFNPEGRTADELARQQAALLALFEAWEESFAALRRENRRWKSLPETRTAVDNMRLIESLWKENKRASDRLSGTPVEDLSIIQYRAMLFMRRRKEYRAEQERLLGANSEPDKSQQMEPMPLAAKLPAESDQAERPYLPVHKRKDRGGRTTQKALDSFFPR